jgi:hypothetical protein
MVAYKQAQKSPAKTLDGGEIEPGFVLRPRLLGAEATGALGAPGASRGYP